MIVGCDYSTKYVHLAWYRLTEGWNYPRLAVDDDLGQFLYDLRESLPPADGDGAHIYIERPWARYNVHTGMLMQRVATIVDVVATQAGYDTHWVAISSWRSKVFGKGKYDTKTAKLKAIAIAKQKLGIDVDDNTADAVCLAMYGDML